MHLTNEMLALLPSNGTPSTTTTSPSSMTSPTMSCYPGGGQYSAFPFTGLPGNSIGCMQTYAAGFNGLSAVTVNALLNGVQAPYNGYNMGGGVPASYAIATNGMSPNGMNGINGMNGVNVSPVTTCTTSAACNASPPYSGLTINGVPFVPPTALTSPEVYGLPPPSTTTATKSSASTDSPSSGETSPAPLSPAASLSVTSTTVSDSCTTDSFAHHYVLTEGWGNPEINTMRNFARLVRKDSAKRSGHLLDPSVYA